MNNTIRELKAVQEERDAMIQALSKLMEEQKMYMNVKFDEDNHVVTDSNGDMVYDIPEPDTTDFNMFSGYQKCIDAIYKLLK